MLRSLTQLSALLYGGRQDATILTLIMVKLKDLIGRRGNFASGISRLLKIWIVNKSKNFYQNYKWIHRNTNNTCYNCMSSLDALLLYICLPNMLVCWCKVRCREYQLFWRAAASSLVQLLPLASHQTHSTHRDQTQRYSVTALHVTQADNMSRLYIADINVG